MLRCGFVWKIVCLISLLVVSSSGQEWLELEDKQGRSITLRVTEHNGDTIRAIRKKDGRKFKIAVDKFSDESRAKIKAWSEASAAKEEAKADGKLDKKLYPRSRNEIAEKLEEIRARRAPKRVPEDQHKAVTKLNEIRFLCGVSPHAEIDLDLVEKAQEAAETCKKAGRYSHELGGHTESCCLWEEPDIARSVQRYVQDWGDNNREKRGHRLICLSPNFKKTGFGTDGEKFSAMWGVGFDPVGLKESWAYPGKGFFPKDYVWGAAWTLYLSSGAGEAPPSKELSVEFTILTKRPEKLLKWNETPVGEKREVKFVGIWKNAINFEPDIANEPGIYYVRIKGGGVREQYLVELY